MSDWQPIETAPKDIYIVTRHGVYIRGIVGAYSTKALAEAAMQTAKAREPDDYHDFTISGEQLDAEVSDPDIAIEHPTPNTEE